MNEEDIKKFIVEDLNSNHSEFIVNAMYSGLIIAGISFDFFEDENSKHIECNTEKSLVTQKRCTDIPNDIKHNYYRHQTQDISDLFGYQCLFEDTYVHQDTTKLYRESDRAILDIDLDFFTYRYNKTYPKHIDDIEHQITSDSFYNLLDKCSIVTIALEPKYCGGGTNSIEILNIFNECIFKPEGLNVIDKVESTLLNYEV